MVKEGDNIFKFIMPLIIWTLMMFQLWFTHELLGNLIYTFLLFSQIKNILGDIILFHHIYH